jgi:hypothetical protein
MAGKETVSPKGRQQVIIATWVLAVGTVTLLALGITAIIVDKTKTMDIFNTILPVVASWVGTVLAFYFGRENFVSASEQARETFKSISPEEVNKEPASTLMRSINQMTYFAIPAGNEDKDIKLSDLRAKFDPAKNVYRLPVLYSTGAPKYMIHQSRFDNYLAEGGKPEDTLETFISNQKGKNVEYGLNKGFVIVSAQTSVADAKRQLEKVPSCQDIFIAQNGKPDEPLIGWISDGKLSQYLEG